MVWVAKKKTEQKDYLQNSHKPEVLNLWGQKSEPAVVNSFANRRRFYLLCSDVHFVFILCKQSTGRVSLFRAIFAEILKKILKKILKIFAGGKFKLGVLTTYKSWILEVVFIQPGSKYPLLLQRGFTLLWRCDSLRSLAGLIVWESPLPGNTLLVAKEPQWPLPSSSLFKKCIVPKKKNTTGCLSLPL